MIRPRSGLPSCRGHPARILEPLREICLRPRKILADADSSSSALARRKEPSMDVDQLLDWREISRAALDALKDASRDLPENDDRRELVEKKIRLAEEMLARADAKLAKDLGSHLCDCTWPPQIMRWQESQSAHVCPN